MKVSRFASVIAALAAVGCATNVPTDGGARMALLKHTNTRLHERLEKAAASEPLVASALAARGQVVLAIRSGLIEQLAGNVAQRYLDHVTLDLKGLGAKGSGELGKDTFLGHITLGAWRVRVDLGNLVGDLRAGTPRVGLRGPNLIDIELPVDVRETRGDAKLHFTWDSAALANVVCQDFELTREITGRVLAQRHLLSGAFQLDNTGETLTATPVFPDRLIPLELDLTDRAWAVVEEALRSQNTSGKCGMLIKPERVVAQLKELAAIGIKVRLPDSIFRTVRLPARMHQSVKVNRSVVRLALKAGMLRIDTATLWSSVSVQVETR